MIILPSCLTPAQAVAAEYRSRKHKQWHSTASAAIRDVKWHRCSSSSCASRHRCDRTDSYTSLALETQRGSGNGCLEADGTWRPFRCKLELILGDDQVGHLRLKHCQVGSMVYKRTTWVVAKQHFVSLCVSLTGILPCSLLSTVLEIWLVLVGPWLPHPMAPAGSKGTAA